ncbi:MAG: trimeric intracellular cation channel family protein [Candidatus Moranbacteria bacterium]|nr:trimeric intracellular cation channel family protein [Candidatus Moranbacteria bacterium]
MYYLDLIGTLAFAIAGAFKAKSRGLNIFGVVFLGIITAVGGGTFRDLIIGRAPLFYLEDSNYLLVAIAGGILTFTIPHIFKKGYSWFRFLDSIGLAAFVIIGASVTHKHLFADYSDWSVIAFLASVFMGMVTGFGGGVIRDAIMGDTPYAFKQESTYITATFIGAFAFYVLMFLDINLAVLVSFLLTMVWREVVSKYGLCRRVLKNTCGFKLGFDFLKKLV